MANPRQPADDIELVQLFELGEKRYARYKETGSPLHLNSAYDAWRKLDERAPKGWPYRPELDYNLGLALCEIARSSRDEMICQQAIDRLKAARDSAAFNNKGRAIVASELAAAYAESFNLTKSTVHLSEAIQAMRVAVAASDPASVPWFEHRTALGRLLFRRHSELKESGDLLSSLEIMISAWQSNRRLFESLPDALMSLSRAVTKGAEYDLIAPYLSSAMAIAEETLTDPALADPLRSQWLLALARCLFVRFQDTGNEADRGRALHLMNQRLELLAEDREIGRFLPSIRRMSGGLREQLLEIYLSHYTAADLDAAIDAIPELHRALYADTDRGEEAFQAKWLEGLTSHERYKKSRTVDDLRSAASAYEELLKMPLLRASNANFRSSVLQSATLVYFELYWCTGELDLLNLAIEIAREAYADAMHVKRTIIDSPRRETTDREALFGIELGLPLFAQSLGLALGEAYLRTGKMDLLEEAIKYCRESLTLQSPWFDPGHDGGEVLHGSLGSVLRYRYWNTKEEKDIAEAIWHQRKAVELAREHITKAGRWEPIDGTMKLVPPPPDRLASSLNNLGTSLRERYRQTHSHPDLAEAVKCHREAISLSPEGEPNYLHYVCNLFDDLAYSEGLAETDISHDELRQIADANTAGPAYQIVTLNADIGRWAFLERNWVQAVESFRRASTARDRLVSIQMRFMAKAWWLSTAQGISAANAFALAKLDQCEEAATVFEEGLATMISSSLRWSDVQLDRVRRLDQTLSQKLSDARTTLQGLEAPRESWMGPTAGMDGVGATLARRQAWSVLKETEEAAKSRIGVDQWSLIASLGSIRETLLRNRERALVYVATTELGSVALIVTSSGVEKVWATMTSSDLRRIVYGRDQNGLSLLDLRSASGPRFDGVLCGLLKELGGSLMAPCVDWLRAHGVKQAFLVPVGQLTLLPLHAATWQTGGVTTTLLDELEVSYLPNATVGVFHGGWESTGESLLKQVVAFGNPRPSQLRSLQSAEDEVKAISKVLARWRPKPFLTTEATRDSFMQNHGSASIFHFAGHGIFDTETTVNSRLIFSNDGSISVAELLGHAIQPRRGAVAVLSGCQTAVVDSDSLPDESLGLPASLLVAGFSQVIGSLWSVDDRATALLMVRLYELLDAEVLSFSQALRLATIWLRDAEPSVLNGAIAKHALRCDAFPEDMSMKDKPSLWSAFIHCGAL